MVIALDPKATWEHIAKVDAESERPTVWILRGLTAGESQKIEDQTVIVEEHSGGSGKGSIGYKTGTRTLLALRHGLIGVRDFYDAEGNAIEFETERVGLRAGLVSDNFLSRIPDSVRTELANEIRERNSLSGDQLGN